MEIEPDRILFGDKEVVYINTSFATKQVNDNTDPILLKKKVLPSFFEHILSRHLVIINQAYELFDTKIQKIRTCQIYSLYDDYDVDMSKELYPKMKFDKLDANIIVIDSNDGAEYHQKVLKYLVYFLFITIINSQSCIIFFTSNSPNIVTQ